MSKKKLIYKDFPFKKQWGGSCFKQFWEENQDVVIDSMKIDVIPTYMDYDIQKYLLVKPKLGLISRHELVMLIYKNVYKLEEKFCGI